MAEDASTDAKVIVRTVNEGSTWKRLKDADFDSEKFREYRHDHQKRGRAVIVNYREFENPKLTRHGSEKDVARLENILQHHLEFMVVTWETKGIEGGQLLKMVKEEAARPEHEESDCFLMVLMTHGGEGGLLKAYSTYFKLDQVVESFTGDKCKGLRGKPKIFVVQACRGDTFQSGVPQLISKGMAPPPPPPDVISLPTHSDIVIAQSQYEGFFSLRNLKSGSYFIQALCDVLEHDIKKPDERKDDLLRLLTLTSNCVAQFEFMQKYSGNDSGDGTDRDGDSEQGVESDATSPAEGSAQGEATEMDAKPYTPPRAAGNPTLQAMLVKQQPTVVSTLLRLYYLRNKGTQRVERKGVEDSQTNDKGARERGNRSAPISNCTLM